MPQGLQCWDAAGNLIIDVTTYVGAFTGSFTTGGVASGSHTDASLIGRSLLHFISDTGDYNGRGGPTITFNASTGTISWQYTYNVSGMTAPAIPNDTIYYGGY